MSRRGKGEGTLYQRPDGIWRAMVDLGWQAGKRVRRSMSGATRREVVDKLKEARRAMDAGLQPVSDRLTVAAYLEDWLEATRDKVRPATWQRYRGIVRTHHIPRLGRFSLTKLTPGDVERMLRDMDGAPWTRHHARAVLRTALARAVAHGLILRNPAAWHPRPESSIAKSRHGTPLRSAPSSTRYAATGWRPCSPWP